MARKFLATSPYSSLPFDADAVRAAFRQLIVTGCVIVSDTGFLAGVLAPIFFSPEVKVASEISWWWEPGTDPAPARELFEHWAQSQGAQGVQLATFNSKHAAGLGTGLTQAGYFPVEISYLKAL